MKTSTISYGFLGFFLLTIFALQWWQLPDYPLWLTGCMSLLLIIGIIFYALKKFRGEGRMLFACSLGILIALISVSRTTHITTKDDVEYYADGEIHELHGRVIDAPDSRPTVTKLTVLADHISTDSGTKLVTGRVLVNDNGGWPEHPYGERVTVRGKVEKPLPIDTFAYDEYLSVRGIYAIVPRARVERAPDDATHPMNVIEWLTGAIFSLRTHFEDQINRVFPEPHASLLAGLMTGSRRGIPKHLTDDFRSAGITHIIAISGYNVTIILTLLSGLLFWVPLKKRFPMLVIGILLFTIFVGGSASVVRASIMGILGLLALQTGRQTSTILSILWTGFLMLVWNPKYLWYDASFQLSFLAILGLALLSNPLKKLLKKVPETLALRESLIATIAAQIATIPLTIILFRQFSLIAPVTNILVAPLIPLAMLLGFIATIVSAVWMPLGLVIGYLAWAVLQAIIMIAQICAHVPGAVISW